MKLPRARHDSEMLTTKITKNNNNNKIINSSNNNISEVITISDDNTSRTQECQRNCAARLGEAATHRTVPWCFLLDAEIGVPNIHTAGRKAI